ncbi:unnamed protein product [Symbiodinium necroappetens]|uniref:Uncharacterized protein n=1 Tax=Symbiodinium necroappetens TaxID=1628268 RepID=A0A812ZE65_9DINO|nr:unnamed protein product [Symbiodinium necroappetens]
MPASLVSQAVGKTSPSVVLAEIAQTPASLPNKLWQLEGALEFELVDVTAAGLHRLGGRAKLKSVPVFVIWTPYRNVYASISDLRNNIDELKNETAKTDAKIDETKSELEAKIDQLEATIDQTKSELKTDIQTMQQKITAAIKT